MRKWPLILLLIPSLAGAVDIVRQGDIVVMKANCFVLNLTELDQKIPEGVTPLDQMMLILATSVRGLTPEEQAICNNTPIHSPLWVVAKNGTNITRPVYELIDPLTHERKATKLRAQVGTSECENAVPTYSLPTTGRREWRYLAGQTTHVVVCEYL